MSDGELQLKIASTAAKLQHRWGATDGMVAFSFMETVLYDTTADVALATLGFPAYVRSLVAAASAAAARLLLGFTAIAAKGDIFVGTAADTIATKSAPANGRIRMAASSQWDGWLVDTDHDTTISAGGAMDSTNAYWLALGSTRIDAARAVGTDQGGLDEREA